MKFTDEQLGFIYRFKDRMLPADMGAVMGRSRRTVKDQIHRMRHVTKDTYPMSKQEELALWYMEHKFESEILAFEFAFDDCLNLPGQNTLRRGFL